MQARHAATKNPGQKLHRDFEMSAQTIRDQGNKPRVTAVMKTKAAVTSPALSTVCHLAFVAEAFDAKDLVSVKL